MGGLWITSRDAAGRSLPGILIAFVFALAFVIAVSWRAGFGSPAARTALEHVAVVQQAIKHGGDGGAVAEQLAPVVHGTIDGDAACWRVRSVA